MKNKREEFTIEKLRTFKGLENLTDEEAQKALQTLKTLARLTYAVYKRNKEELIREFELHDKEAE